MTEHPLAPARTQNCTLTGTPGHTFDGEKLDKSLMLDGPLRQDLQREAFDWHPDFHQNHEVTRRTSAGVA